MNNISIDDKIIRRIVLGVILLVGTFIRLYFFVGPAPATDGMYFLTLINKLITGQLNLLEESTYGFRFFMYFPLAAVVLITGYNEFYVTIPGLIFSIAGIVLTYKLTLEIKENHSIALLAAFLIAIYPLDVVYSTAITLDVPASFFMSLSLYYYIIAIKKEETVIDEKEIRSNYFLSGLFLGISYQTRELGAMIVILFILLFFIRLFRDKKQKRTLFLRFTDISIGFLLLIMLELLITYINCGNPFIRYQKRFGLLDWDVSSVMGGGATIISLAVIEMMTKRSKRFYEITRLDRYIIMILTPSYAIGYIFYLFAFSVLMIWFSRTNNSSYNRKRTKTILFWIIFVLVYLEFGTQSPFTWILIEKQARFLNSVAIPVWSINALGIDLLYEFLRKNNFKKFFYLKKVNAIVLVVAITITITSSNYLFALEEYARLSQAKPTKEIYDYLKDTPIRHTYVYPSVFVQNLEYYFAFKHQYIHGLYGDTEILADSYVIISEGVFNSFPFPDNYESVNVDKWILLISFTKIRTSTFSWGFSYNYTTYIFYVPPD